MLKTVIVLVGAIALVNAALSVSGWVWSDLLGIFKLEPKILFCRSSNRNYRGTEVQLCLEGRQQLPTFKWAKCPVKEDGKIVKGEFDSEDVRVPRRVYERFFSGWRPKRNMLDSCKKAFRTFQKNAVGRTWGTASRMVVENVCSMIDNYEEDETPKSTEGSKKKFDQFDELAD
ncbi:hypothetical protein FOZ61_005201 [Perkinsus olseni]|uniref:Uncharacterized protein n=1 Tax=Perkinsus olseni TaxID=32597 RepID=A0A7J6LHV4_PEROL|nr:hypothetical protein FOZ61_005201 [Perkinsus olseni]KAF4663541.1 hypothetical protein FOL46_004695 [Perkinsus olseni]